MAGIETQNLTARGLWSQPAGSSSAADTLERVLGSVINLPIKYWRPAFFFIGAADEKLYDLTARKFPIKILPHGTHPVYSLHPLPRQVGFKVCPCSSKKPFHAKTFRYIRIGCRLLHTGHKMDRNSYVLEKLSFPMPPDPARGLRFKGEVPKTCMEKVETEKRGANPESGD